MRNAEAILFLVVLATVVAAFARRLRVPAPSLLVVAGALVGLLPDVPTTIVTPDAVSLVILPPLLFAAGEELPWRDLRAVWRPVTVLAVGLVLVSAAVVGVVAIALTPLPAGMAFVLGAALASTDPVAVTALGRRLSLPPRVRALVQAESLFNDATSLLLFRVALSVAVTAAVSWGRTLAEFGVLVGAGLLAGVITAAGAVVIRLRTEDPTLETVLGLVTPYAAYVMAEAMHGSGVTAVVLASVILNTQAARLTNARIRLRLTAVYETVVFLLESVVFGVIGLQLPALVRSIAVDGRWPLYALALAATVIVLRFLWLFPLSAVVHRQDGRSSWRVPTVVSWAGTRGVVPLAAALSIPLVTPAGAALPGRDLVLLLTTSVIVITLVVQGITLAPVVRWAGIAMGAEDIRQEQAATRLRMAQAGLAHLDDLSVSEDTPESVIDQLRGSWRARIDRIEADDAPEPAEPSSALAYQRLRKHLIAVEAAELNRLYGNGTVTDATRRRIQRQLDLEHAALSDDEP